MVDIKTKKDIKNYPILDEPKLYVYIMLNDIGKVKIGKTKNIQQRYQSLCGSNGQGNKIVKMYISNSTYLYTLENIMHDKFNKYRIPNTEWFYDKFDVSGEILFNKIVKELELLFSSITYEKCNSLRKKNYKDKNKGGDTCDH